MKGYVLLALFSVTVLILTPFAAFNRTATQPVVPTPAPPEKTAVFQVKNTQTDEVLTFSETDFLIGIVSCEMAPSSPPEALKAQAVAAYTYYCKQRAAATDGIDDTAEKECQRQNRALHAQNLKIHGFFLSS